jgi:Domain of unknown function (DUF1857)
MIHDINHDTQIAMQNNVSSLFNDLIELSRSDKADFKTISDMFNKLSKNHKNKFSYDFVIEDYKKGSLFHKVAEIKAQQAHRFVDEIKDCKFVNKETDGFTRKITINVPGEPEFQERLFIDKKNDEINVFFVQNDNKDTFACFNHVYLNEGKWHWAGIYLYGELNDTFENERQNKQNMFDSTFENMMKLLEDESTFDNAYNSLQNY